MWGRLAELVLLYFLVGLLALALERRLGQIYPQGWEFYAITATLFVTLAFPGFVWRYLTKRRGPAKLSGISIKQSLASAFFMSSFERLLLI